MEQIQTVDQKHTCASWQTKLERACGKSSHAVKPVTA
jgi:hypothetical protein